MPLETQFFLRIVYSCYLFAFFAIISQYGKIYFTTEKVGGCIKSSPLRDRLFGDTGYQILMTLWLGTLVLMFFGVFPIFASFLNLIFCYVHFVRMRWVNLNRGMGAPGYCSFWLGALIFLLEYSTYCGDSDGKLRDLVLIAFKLDMALMMLDTGINKIFHGYRSNEGMNYGMVNPAWGHFANFFTKFHPEHFVFHFCNNCAWLFQITGAVCMLIPPLQWVGAAIISGSFLFVKTQIRLGVLCDKVILMTIIFTGTLGWLHTALLNFIPPVSGDIMGMHEAPVWINGILSGLLWFYICFLPFAKLGMYYNLYGRKRLPEVLQKTLDFLTNAMGIILWRVFTFELLEYYILTSFENRTTKIRKLHTNFGHWEWGGNNRFLWVGESIATIITFNSKRYFGQEDIFREKVLRYARTMGCPQDSVVIFEHVAIVPGESSYEHKIAKEYCVDPVSGDIQEKVIDPNVVVYRPRKGSPVHVSAQPGSYAPRKEEAGAENTK